jgi:patatin-like phospholipase/acyl hydrolase
MRILTFDGGGIRGILTAQLLLRLEEAVPGFLARAEFLAGTSTGSIVALSLACGLEPSAIVQLFRELGPKVFTKRDFLDGITHADELFRADFDGDPLREAMVSVWGEEKTLGDLDKKVLIPSFDLDNQDAESRAKATRVYKDRFWKPKYMHNFDSVGNDRDIKVVDAAMRSSSAPTYFPSYQGYVDGGIVDNNPSMSALAKAIKASGLVSSHALMSVGTGFNPRYIEGDDLDWGFKQWLTDKRLLNVLFDGMLGVPHYQCKQVLNGRYLRLDKTLKEVIDLADVDKMDDLVEVANGMDITKAVLWLEEIWMSDDEGVEV